MEEVEREALAGCQLVVGLHLLGHQPGAEARTVPHPLAQSLLGHVLHIELDEGRHLEKRLVPVGIDVVVERQPVALVDQ